MKKGFISPKYEYLERAYARRRDHVHGLLEVRELVDGEQRAGADHAHLDYFYKIHLKMNN